MSQVRFKDPVFKQAICDLFGLDDTMTLEDLSRIEEIVFYDSGNYGDGGEEQYFVKLKGHIKSLEDLCYFPNLKNLALNFSDPDNPQIWGDLKDIIHLNHLEKLNLSASQIVGNTLQVKHLTHLKELILTGEGISGQLVDLQSLTQLERLNLIDTKITGNLTDLLPLKYLKTIVTAWTPIEGDIATLSEFKSLERFDANNDFECKGQIEGNIAVFQSFQNMKDISLCNVAVHGDISVLKDLNHLYTLDLSGTDVVGDIKSLSKLTKLKNLDLAKTEVKGDIESFAQLIQLEDVNLYACYGICGDIAVLNYCKHVRAVCFVDTLVSGDPLRLTSLEYLNECALFLCANVINNDEVQEELRSLGKDEIILLDDLDDDEVEESNDGEVIEYRYNEQDLSLLEAFREKHIGHFKNVFHEMISDELHVDLYVSPPTDDRDYYIVMTEGMGAFEMNVPDEIPRSMNHRRAEILCYLPSDWNLDFEKDDRSYWPFGFMKSIARLPIRHHAWVGELHTMGDEEPFAANTALCAGILTQYINLVSNTIEPLSVKLSDGKEVDILTMVPLYHEELKFKQAVNSYDLLRELKYSIGLREMAIINPQRAKAIVAEPEFEDFEVYQHTRIPLENPEQIVTFEDAGFEEAVRKLYGLEGEIRHKDIGYIEKMEFSTYIKNGVIDLWHIDFDKKIKSLKDLHWFPNLLSLGLCGHPGDPIFFGELKDITVLKRLVELQTGGAILKGDIKELKKLPYLRDITITGQGIRGKLSDIAGFKDLKCLYVCDTRVTGDLSDIAHLSNLDYLCLSYSLFTGDVQHLSHMTKITDLSLDASAITGDIKHFANMKDLEYVTMGDTEIEGDIQVFAHMPNLKEIEIYSTNITGDIGGLKALKEIRTLDVSDTDVSGAVLALKELPVLREVAMCETNIDYEVSDFDQFDKVDFVYDEDEEDSDELEDENEMDEEDDDDDLFECIWYRKLDDAYEYFEFMELSGVHGEYQQPQGTYRQGMVGETSIKERVYMENAYTLLKEKEGEGFANMSAFLKPFHFTVADFPRVNPEALVDSVAEVLDQYGLGYVENYEVLTISDELPEGYHYDKEFELPEGKMAGEEELLIMALVIDDTIAEKNLEDAFGGYGIQFGIFAEKLEQEA
ncbi:MAG: suppressor of fused domain protein [Alcaligenaceae bacterium]|nr:suppressor of fused domain protein [Alcaligenaceae bacterium]